jgi:hypothetical protein
VLGVGKAKVKTGLWLIVGAALVFWALAGMLGLQLTQWLAASLPQWAGKLPPLAQWPEPSWLAFFGVDPALLQALHAGLGWLLEVLGGVMPSAEALGSVFSVLSVLLGLLWAAGLVLLLGLGLVAHLFISRRQRRRLETV